MRDAVQEVRGAVQRIDDPAPLQLVLALDLVAFLEQEAVIAPGIFQHVDDGVFRCGIGVGDEIGRAFFRDLKLLDFVEVVQ